MNRSQKIGLAKTKGIFLPDLLLTETIVCVYGFFAVKSGKKECFYIGKTTSLWSRMLDSGSGHVHNYLNGYISKLVPNKINFYIDSGYEVHVEVLEEVDYHDTSFSRATHRLSYAELKHIIKYQEKGECLDQRPEGIGKNEEKYWTNNYYVK
ncbi:MAG: hypothetical protein RR565_09345 [Erysipelothrix sp.]